MTKAEKRAEAQSILDELKKIGVVKAFAGWFIFEGNMPNEILMRTLAVDKEIAELLNSV
mgnify:CR=1 FL=1